MPSEHSVEVKFLEIFADLAPIRSMYPNIVKNLEEIQQAFRDLFIHYDSKCKQLRETEEELVRKVIEV